MLFIEKQYPIEFESEKTNSCLLPHSCSSDFHPTYRGQHSTSYPSKIKNIYSSVQRLLDYHIGACDKMPLHLRQEVETLASAHVGSRSRKQYWIDAAKRLGMVDTPLGIRFARDPTEPLPAKKKPLTNNKQVSQRKSRKRQASDIDRAEMPSLVSDMVDFRPLVTPEDKPLVQDYLYVAYQQMAACTLTEADKAGAYKKRKVGFPGIVCKHCATNGPNGRYFPASEEALAQTTQSRAIVNHIRNCLQCPKDIRDNMETMLENCKAADGRPEKPKFGNRKVFFHRLWRRIQNFGGQPSTDEQMEENVPKKRRSKREQEETDENEEEEREEVEAGAEEDAKKGKEEAGDDKDIKLEESAPKTNRRQPPVESSRPATRESPRGKTKDSFSTDMNKGSSKPNSSDGSRSNIKDIPKPSTGSRVLPRRQCRHS